MRFVCPDLKKNIAAGINGSCGVLIGYVDQNYACPIAGAAPPDSGMAVR